MLSSPSNLPYINRTELEAEPEEVVQLYARAHKHVPRHIIDSGTKSQMLDAIFRGRTYVPGIRVDNPFRNPVHEEILLNRYNVLRKDVIPGLKEKQKRIYHGFKPHLHKIVKALQRQESRPTAQAGRQNTGGEIPQSEDQNNDADPVENAQGGPSHQSDQQITIAGDTTDPRRLKRSYAFVVYPPRQPSPPAPDYDSTSGDDDDDDDDPSLAIENDQAIGSDEDSPLLANSQRQDQASVQDPEDRRSVSPAPDDADEEGSDQQQGDRHSPFPPGPDLGFIPNEDLSDLRSALEDFLPHTTPDDPQPPETAISSLFDEAPISSDMNANQVLRRRFEITVKNHYDLQQAFAAAVEDSSQAIYDLTAIQDELRTEEHGLQQLLDRAFHMVRKRKDIIANVMEGGPVVSKLMWEDDWGQEWVSDDEKEEDELRELATQRKLRSAKKKQKLDKGKGIERSLKRSRDAQENHSEISIMHDDLDTSERQSKRARVDGSPEDDPEAPTTRLDKGKGRALPEDAEEDHLQARPPNSASKSRRKFTPADRRDTDPVHDAGRRRFTSRHQTPAQQAGSSSLMPDSTGEPDGEDDDENNNEQDAAVNYGVPSQLPNPPSGKLNEHDWDNELYQLLKYDRANEGRRSRGYGWYEGARDKLEDADREPVSWLNYGKKYGEDDIRSDLRAKQWRDWDDILQQVNPYTLK